MKPLFMLNAITLSVLLLILSTCPSLYARDHEDVEDIGNRKINGRVAWVFPNFVSFEKELQIGADYARLLEETIKLVEDPVVLSYVRGLAQQIVRMSDAKSPFVIKVIDSDEVNAFALPGGFFYINRGLILEVENESELAGVMAHEIAHVTARHATESMTRGQIIQIAAIPALFIGGYWTQVGIRQGLGLGISLSILGISRGSEAEADQLGTQYAWNAGYDPGGFITFFQKLQAREKDKPGRFGSFFRTHPLLDDRIEKVEEEISFLPVKREYIITTSRLGLIQDRLRVPETTFAGSGVNRPTLRRKPTIKGEDEKKKERPTLKRGDEE